MASELKKLGFQQCMVDPCIFGLMDGEQVRTIVGVRVDDTIVVSSNQDCRWLKENLSKAFPVKHLGVLIWYMGYSFQRDAIGGTLKTLQETFANSLVDRHGVVKESPIPARPVVE